MNYSGIVKLYSNITKKYVGNNKEEEIREYIGTYVCSIYNVRDVINDTKQGRITGKTKELYFLEVIPNFKYVEIDNNLYEPVGITEVGGRSIIEVEGVDV